MAYPEKWINPDQEKGWALFALHAQRLASHYDMNNINSVWQFVKDFALVFGGMPTASNGVLGAVLASRNGPAVTNGYVHKEEFKSYIYESNDGLAGKYWDYKGFGENQSHHYAGTFFTSYFLSMPLSTAANYFGNQGNPDDIDLGNGAIQDSMSFANGSSIYSLIMQYVGQ